MAARKRDLKPDPQGRYRPRIGWESAFEGTKYLGRRQPRFNLGTDRKEALRRYERILQLYEDNCQSTGDDLWSPVALEYARGIASGSHALQYPPLPEGYRVCDRTADYARSIEIDRRMFPSIQIVPQDPAMYAESVQLNERLVYDRLRQLEAELRELGALVTDKSLPDKLVVGTFYEALDAYVEQDIRRDGAKLPNGTLKPFQRLRIKRVDRLKKHHTDFPLYELTLDRCKEVYAYWRNRPVTKRGTALSRDAARHMIQEWDRFFDWLDQTDSFNWEQPRRFASISKKIVQFESERKKKPVTKSIYTPTDLGRINQNLTVLGRLAMYLGLNCAMGAAELGRLEIEDFLLSKRHEFAEQLDFITSDDDSFLRYFRPKTGMFGEWLLWPETVEMVGWGIDRARRIGTNLIFAWETGKPMYDEASENPQASFANIWNETVKRIRKHDESLTALPFGTLRDTLPDKLRRSYDRDLASICLTHRTSANADNLLDCYANRPFGRLHEVLRELHSFYTPLFTAVADPLDEAKHYLPGHVRERVLALLAEERSVIEIAKECGVSTMTVYRLRSRPVNGKPKKSM